MACLKGALLSSGLLTSSTRPVRPQGTRPRPAWESERVELLAFERLFMKMPLQFASYPALAFRLRKVQPQVLKESLSVVLNSYPMLAGRMCGNAVALTNDGVPFTVVEDSRVAAPAVLEERELLSFNDFRVPQRILAGQEPLLTVKVTCFRDGSGVLGVCRTHGLLDGSAAWGFLASWAQVARGDQSLKHGSSDRQPVRDMLPNDEELQATALELMGAELKATWRGWAQDLMFPLMATAFNTLFFLNLKGLGRPRVFFSHAELARIKDAATPPKSLGGDGWVSTQEALAAHLLVNLSMELLPPTSDGKALLVFLLDARKALGLGADHSFGVGMTFFQVPMEGLLKQSLPEVAAFIHAVMRDSEDRVRQLWRVFAGANERGLGFSAFCEFHQKIQDYDLVLQLNNQSKRVLPDFGQASGGAAERVLTNAGPSIILPAPGGVELFLNPEVFKSAPTAVQVRALERLRSALPPPPTADAPSKLAAPVSNSAASSQLQAMRSGGA